MKNRDVIRIFRIIPPGTKVLITKENRSFEDIAIERKALIKSRKPLAMRRLLFTANTS